MIYKLRAVTKRMILEIELAKRTFLQRESGLGVRDKERQSVIQ